MGEGLNSICILGRPFWLGEWTGVGGRVSHDWSSPSKIYMYFLCLTTGKRRPSLTLPHHAKDEGSLRKYTLRHRMKGYGNLREGIEGTTTVKPLGPRPWGGIAGSLDAFSSFFLLGDNSLLDFYS